MNRTLAGLALLAAAVTSVSPAAACSSYLDEVSFWHVRRPAAEFSRYVSGDLGVLDRRFGRYPLFVAYRHLTGLGFTDTDRAGLAELMSAPALTSTEDPVRHWLDVRGGIPGVEPKSWLSTEKSEQIERDSQTLYLFYRNCLDDAFEHAARVLSEYLNRFGPASDVVKDWLAAQDQVFSNCPGGEAIPEPLGDSAAPRLRADRDYQIAAAHFYAGHHEEARRRFRRIAEDPASPWRALARYLVGRTLLREGRLEEAAVYLEELDRNPDLRDFHRSARGLLEYARFHAAPVERRREIDRILHEEALSDRLHQELVDYFLLLEPPHPLAELGSELAEWVRVVGWPTDEGRDLAVRRWKEQGSLVWLVAALVLAEPSAPQAEELLAAAAAVPETSPAFVTARYHRYRLAAGLGRLEPLGGEIDSLLKNRSLATGDQNRFQALRARLVGDLEEYLELTQQVPVELVYDGGYLRRDVHEALLPSWKPGYRLPRPELVDLLNRGLTTAELVDLVRCGTVVPELRRRIVLAAWTRSLVLGDEASTRAALPLVRDLVPELREELRAVEAASAEERPFVAALGLLRFPGLHPDVHTGGGRGTPLGEIDNVRANWWCPGTDFGLDPTRPLPAFVDPGGAAGERERLRTLEAGPIHLGRVVLDRADRRPDDPRVPEALHRVVRATRFGCPLPQGGYGPISRRAFEKLHQRYPESPWAEKTKYWFD